MAKVKKYIIPLLVIVASNHQFVLRANASELELNINRDETQLELTINVSGASVYQVLEELELQAGIVVNAINLEDVPVFGEFGPGDPHDIIYRLLGENTLFTALDLETGLPIPQSSTIPPDFNSSTAISKSSKAYGLELPVVGNTLHKGDSRVVQKQTVNAEVEGKHTRLLVELSEQGATLLESRSVSGASFQHNYIMGNLFVVASIEDEVIFFDSMQDPLKAHGHAVNGGGYTWHKPDFTHEILQINVPLVFSNIRSLRLENALVKIFRVPAEEYIPELAADSEVYSLISTLDPHVVFNSDQLISSFQEDQ